MWECINEQAVFSNFVDMLIQRCPYLTSLKLSTRSTPPFHLWAINLPNLLTTAHWPSLTDLTLIGSFSLYPNNFPVQAAHSSDLMAQLLLKHPRLRTLKLDGGQLIHRGNIRMDVAPALKAVSILRHDRSSFFDLVPPDFLPQLEYFEGTVESRDIRSLFSMSNLKAFWPILNKEIRYEEFTRAIPRIIKLNIELGDERLEIITGSLEVAKHVSFLQSLRFLTHLAGFMRIFNPASVRGQAVLVESVKLPRLEFIEVASRETLPANGIVKERWIKLDRNWMGTAVGYSEAGDVIDSKSWGRFFLGFTS
ncbi:hypothetical protein M422DRAFT_41617 [Sphaerobolus stellatus SS14]|nr:hypothetical protein M422DRAFT_41617 [Sphaerobolus stellatus SS14]